MDALAVKQACRFAKEHALKNGPIVSFLILLFPFCILNKFLLQITVFSASYHLNFHILHVALIYLFILNVQIETKIKVVLIFLTN